MTVFAFIILSSLFWLKISIKLWTLMGNYLVLYVLPTGNWHINLLLKYYVTVFLRVTKVVPQPLCWVDFEGLSRICKPLDVLQIKYLLPHAQKAAGEQQLGGDYWAVESGAPARSLLSLYSSVWTQGTWRCLKGRPLNMHRSFVHLTHNGSCL